MTPMKPEQQELVATQARNGKAPADSHAHALRVRTGWVASILVLSLGTAWAATTVAPVDYSAPAQCSSARAVHDRSCDNYTGYRTRDGHPAASLADALKPAPTATAEPKARPAAGTGLKAGAAIERGVASWYGPGFHGRLTANGEVFNQHALTAAHKTLPFGTQVVVRNQRTGKEVVVRINDRGPFAKGRIIDLSKAAAERLQMVNNGHDRVVLRTVQQ